MAPQRFRVRLPGGGGETRNVPHTRLWGGNREGFLGFNLAPRGAPQSFVVGGGNRLPRLGGVRFVRIGSNLGGQVAG